MSVKHTPGPWAMDGQGVVYGQNGNDEAPYVADVTRDGKYDGNNLTQQERANGMLIAAAPELLAMLTAVLLFHSGSPWTPDKQAEWESATDQTQATTRALCDAVRNAIARATGEDRG